MGEAFMRTVPRLAVLAVAAMVTVSTMTTAAQAAISPGADISAFTMEGATDSWLLGARSIIIWWQVVPCRHVPVRWS